MGAPIKVASPQSNSKPESDQRSRKKWADFRFYLIPIGLILLVDAILFNYLKFLPTLDPKLFESLVQVIATLLGFTIVAFFYYLGKMDDRRNNYMDSLSRYVRVKEDYISGNEQRLKNALAAIDKIQDSNQFHEAEQLRLGISAISEIKEKMGTMKSSIVNSLKIFEEVADSIRYDFNLVVISYSIGIVLSFIALFLTTSEPAKQITNYWTWAILVLIVLSIVSTSYLFNRIWKSLQHFSDFLYKKSLAHQLSD